MQFLRLTCLAVFGIVFFVSIATFKNIAGFKYAKPLGLWIVYILWPLVCTVVYIVSQLTLVFRTLEDRWPIGDILFGTAFFTIAQVILFAFSATICDAIKHYIDGLFFFTLCMLLSVMMVYKYWDSITVRTSTHSVHTDVLTARTERGPGVLCRVQGDRLGSEGPAARRWRFGPVRLRRPERISGTGEPRRRSERWADVPGRRAGLSTSGRAVLSQDTWTLSVITTLIVRSLAPGPRFD